MGSFVRVTRNLFTSAYRLKHRRFATQLPSIHNNETTTLSLTSYNKLRTTTRVRRNAQPRNTTLTHHHSNNTAVELAFNSVVKIFTVSCSPNYLLPWQNKAQRETTGSGQFFILFFMPFLPTRTISYKFFLFMQAL